MYLEKSYFSKYFFKNVLLAHHPIIKKLLGVLLSHIISDKFVAIKNE